MIYSVGLSAMCNACVADAALSVVVAHSMHEHGGMPWLQNAERQRVFAAKMADEKPRVISMAANDPV